MKINLRTRIRITFLALIFVFWFTGNIQFWVPLLGIGLLVIPLWGRIYCGWICPISTSIDLLKPVLTKSVSNTKKFSSHLYTQIPVVIISFLILMIFIKNDFVIPFFIFLIPVGIIVTYLFSEVTWHRNCFIGVIFSWFSNFARKSYYIDIYNCLGCGSCVVSCPNSSIYVDINGNYKIDKKHCLTCNKCKTNCPSNSIQYVKLQKPAE